MQKSGQQLKQQGFDLLDKVKRTSEDEQEAIGYLTQAIQSEQLYGTELSDCFFKIGEVYRDRSTKTQEDYNKALEYFKNSTQVQGLPSWFTPHNHVERLALCPELFGFNPEWRNKELAWDMHNQNLERQNGGDLAITSGDWFGHLLEKAPGKTDPEWIKIGFDYLDKAIEAGWDDLWTSVMYTTYGRGYKYFSEKTAENFALAKEWFEKSIQMDVDANNSNQPWSIIGRGTARAYFELAELLYDPARFGFSESLKDVQEGKDKFNHGKAHVSKYGSLGPYSILENMFVNVWDKSLQYKRTQEDLETIKELCEFGRQIGEKDKDSALYLFEGVGCHAVNDKSDANYAAIVENYYKCLESCNKRGEGSSWMAEQAAKWAVPLVLDCGSQGFSSSARDVESAQKLQSLLHQISKNSGEYNFSPKVREIIDVYAKSQNSGLDLYDTKKDE